MLRSSSPSVEGLTSAPQRILTFLVGFFKKKGGGVPPRFPKDRGFHTEDFDEI